MESYEGHIRVTVEAKTRAVAVDVDTAMRMVREAVKAALSRFEDVTILALVPEWPDYLGDEEESTQSMQGPDTAKKEE